MSKKYKDFITGKDFTNDDIEKILTTNGIEGEILNIQYRPFKKIFVKVADKNNKFCIIKICLDTYSIELAKNESEGYVNLGKAHYKYFNLPEFRLIKSNEIMSISKIEFIDGTKGDFFEFNKFYNFDNKNFYNLSTVNDYIENIKLKIFKSKNIELPKNIDNYLKKISNQKVTLEIPVTSAHGDFAHYNSIKTSKKNFIYDLEFFDPEKVLFYDFFHWHIMSYIFRVHKLNGWNFLITCSPAYFYLLKKYCFSKFIKNSSELKKINIDLHLELFLIEKMMYFLRELRLNNIRDLMHQKQINSIYKIYEIFNKVLKTINN